MGILGEEGFLKVESDFLALKEALARRDSAFVLAHYQEPLFPGVDRPEVDWVRLEVQEEVKRLLWGSPEGLRRIVELDPLDEEALEALVAFLLEKGRRLEARRCLLRHLEALKALEESPSPRVEALLRRLE